MPPHWTIRLFLLPTNFARSFGLLRIPSRPDPITVPIELLLKPSSIRSLNIEDDFNAADFTRIVFSRPPENYASSASAVLFPCGPDTIVWVMAMPAVNRSGFLARGKGLLTRIRTVRNLIDHDDFLSCLPELSDARLVFASKKGNAALRDRIFTPLRFGRDPCAPTKRNRYRFHWKGSGRLRSVPRGIVSCASLIQATNGQRVQISTVWQHLGPLARNRKGRA